MGKYLHNIWVNSCNIWVNLLNNFTFCEMMIAWIYDVGRDLHNVGKFTQHMDKFTQLLHILCNNCQNIKMQQQITLMHRYHAQIVIKTRTMNFFQVKLLRSLRCFLKNLHHWQEFYTTAGRTGRAKYQKDT